MKCPNSWTRIRIPSTTTNATIVVTATYLPASFDSPSCRSLASRRDQVLAGSTPSSERLLRGGDLGHGARRLLRSYPFSRESPRLGIHVDARLDAVERTIRHSIERLGDQLGDLDEPNRAIQERRHRDLVGSVQDRRSTSALCERLSRELEAREPVR